jgi:hypothetical protein
MPKVLWVNGRDYLWSVFFSKDTEEPVIWNHLLWNEWNTYIELNVSTEVEDNCSYQSYFISGQIICVMLDNNLKSGT